jgi:hypothetical protein
MAYSEAFASASNARRAALNFKEHAAVWRYSTFRGQNDRWYWHAQGTNNEIVASGGNFGSEAEASAQANAVRVTVVPRVAPNLQGGRFDQGRRLLRALPAVAVAAARSSSRSATPLSGRCSWSTSCGGGRG